MIRGAVFFDVDGTLTPTSSGQHLTEFLGYTKVIHEVQAGYGAGTLRSQEAAVLEARSWATRTPMEVRGFLESLPLVDGIAETVLWCRRRGLGTRTGHAGMGRRGHPSMRPLWLRSRLRPTPGAR
ncbi:HAD family hydrolase [Micromonospora chersina]|uniref:hypothetical protein n=1 Tax=Micromonospora chersina TaxID=47854 RepID=UPI0037238D1D